MLKTVSEMIYYRMPIFLQNAIFSLYGLKLSKARYNQLFFNYLRNLKESEWWSVKEIQKYQNMKVREVVHHAYHTVPFYRRWYEECKVDIDNFQTVEDLKRLPVLTKQLVRANQQDMVSSAFNRSSLITNLTSGTTGTPLEIYITKECLAFQWAIWWRHRARYGLTIKDRHLTFGARVPIPHNQKRPPFWRHDVFNNRVYLSTYHISKDTVKSIVEFLNSNHFDFFTGYPSAMYNLAALIEEEGLRLINRPKYVVTGADALLPKFESTIRRVFGVPVTEQYGMAEFAGNMSKCECGNFHLDFECCYIEEQPLEGSNLSRLIFTGWGNPAMPFIRYEVGDFGKSFNGSCACGRESVCFESIDGRVEDYVVTPDGRRIIGMNQVLEYAPNAKEIQIFQDKIDSIEFRIVPTKEFSDNDKEALIREFRRRAGSNMSIRFNMVDEIERLPSGKFKAVISTVDSLL